MSPNARKGDSLEAEPASKPESAAADQVTSGAKREKKIEGKRKSRREEEE